MKLTTAQIERLTAMWRKWQESEYDAERQVAYRMFAKECEKLGLNPDKFSSKEETVRFEVRYWTESDLKLLNVLVAFVLGSADRYANDDSVQIRRYKTAAKIRIIIGLSAAERDILLCLYDFYRYHLWLEREKALDNVFSAFIHKHNLLPADTPASKKIGEEDPAARAERKRRQKAIMAMMLDMPSLDKPITDWLPQSSQEQ